MATAEIKRHWEAVAKLGCVVCQRPCQIHHAHSRELSAMGLGRGTSQKTSDRLVIGLCLDHHTGKLGVDSGMGVATWEGHFNSQVHYLKNVSALLGVDVFEKARQEKDDE